MGTTHRLFNLIPQIPDAPPPTAQIRRKDEQMHGWPLVKKRVWASRYYLLNLPLKLRTRTRMKDDPEVSCAGGIVAMENADLADSP
jgi:hypothetical protein